MSRTVSAEIPVAKFVADGTITAVTPTGTDDGETVGYKIVFENSDGQPTAASPEVTNDHAATVMGVDDYETITWTAPAGAVTAKIYRTTGGPDQGLIGSVDASDGTFDDTGIAADPDDVTPSTENVTGAGTPVGVGDFADITVQIGGTFVATLQVQGKIDPIGTWQDIDDAITAPGFVDVAWAAKALSQLRVKCTAYTSGTPVAAVAGH